MNNFREYNQAQGIFRTIVPDELLEPAHPARLIDKNDRELKFSYIFQGKEVILLCKYEEQEAFAP